MKALTVLFKALRDEAILPGYESVGASGFDISTPFDVVIPAQATVLVKTGLAAAVPAGYEMQIRARSGVAYRTTTIIKNGVGTIDSDYRGEIGVLMFNLGADDVVFKAGDRIAQGVIASVERVLIVGVDELPETARGAGGFGSTGK
jgi:dUTP pyrophosphatase